MNNNSYTTGVWLGIVRDGAVVALEAGTDPAVVHHLWAYLGGQPTIHGILHEVTEQFGTSLAGLPSFAIILRGERLHAILRGDIELAAHTGGTTELVSGRDVATWSERSLDLPETLELTLADAPAADAAGDPAGVHARDAGGGDALVLPIAEAVVQFQALHLSTVLAGSTGHASQPEDDGGLPAEAYHEAPVAEGPVGAEGYPVDAGNFPAGDHNYPAAVYDEDFATAAHAADAEWNAQLAPVGEAPLEHELAQTIRPDDDADDDADGAQTPASETPWAESDPAGGDGLVGDGPVGNGTGEAGTVGDVSAESGETITSAENDFPGTEDATESPDLTVHPETEAPGGEAPDTAHDRDDDGFTTNYDFLFGATVTSSVADAAVRADDEGRAGLEGAGVVVPPLPMQPPLAGVSNSQETPAHQAAGHGFDARNPNDRNPNDWNADDRHGPAHEAGPDGVHGPEAAPGQGPAQDFAQEPATAGEGASPDLIDSVPWSSPAGQFPVTAAPAAQAAQVAASSAAVASPTSAQLYDPDHDGHTIMREHLPAAADPSTDATAEGDANAATDASAGAAVQAVLASRPPTGPMVLARVCPNGHANPPSLPQCGSCGAENLSEPREVGRPRLGRMHISTGEVIDLDHSLIIGRQPSVSRVMGEAMPRLVQVKSSNGDISRSHVEVRPDGWDVLLVDLRATNGTVLVREGQAPRRLGQGEEAILLNGDIAELGDGVSLLFDGLL